MEWDIKTLNVDKMLINPMSPKLVAFFEDNVPIAKHIEIEYEPRVFTKAQVYRYILLLYDKGSDIHNRHGLDWFGRKYEACAFAGFPLEKGRDKNYRFDKKVDEMVLGRNDLVNDLIMGFLGFFNNMQWNHAVYLHESLLIFTRDAIGRKNTDYKTTKEYRQIRDELMNVSNEIAHTYEETEEFVRRFYFNIEKSRNSVKPEDYAERLANGDDLSGDSPYGSSYVIDKIKFLGRDESTIKV